MRKRLFFVFMLASLGWSLTGCGASTPKDSTQELKSFKGGPMPPEFAAQLAQSQKDAAKKAAAKLSARQSP